MKKPSAKKVLIILHQPTSTPGRVGMMLEKMGYDLVHCRPCIGEPLPETLDNYSGVVMFGGPMSANDGDDFIKKEINWLDVPLSENTPFLGICLGAQMLVKNLGGTVRANSEEFAEIGYYPLEPTNEGKALMDWPEMVYQWHREGFSMPDAATLLASGTEYPNQAFRVGENAYGIQFHPELTYWMMNRWTTKAAHRFVLNGAQNREAHFEGRALYDSATRIWLKEFLEMWIGQELQEAT